MLGKTINIKVVYFPILIFLGWRLIILIFQVFLEGVFFEGFPPLSLSDKLYTYWMNRWDGGHYLGIADRGYLFDSNQQAFFPLWPAVIKLLTFSGLDVIGASYILSFLLGAGIFILFFLLSKKLIGETLSKKALVCFAAFPSTMFLHAGYSEALFLFLALLSFYLIEKKYFLIAALISGFASGVRIVGVALILPQLLSKQRFYLKVFFSVLCLVGLASYMIYLYSVLGNPLAFLKAHGAWGRHPTLSLLPLWEYTQLLITRQIPVAPSSNFLDWLSSLTFPLLTIAVLKKLGWSYFSYCAVVISMALFSGAFYGMIRAVLVAFPVFMIIPLIIKNDLYFKALCLTMFLIQLRFIALFIHGIWVA